MLPSLVYQGSHSVKKLDDEASTQYVSSLITNLLLNESSQLVVTMIESSEEKQMKDYLLYSEKRLQLSDNNVWILKDISELWRFIRDKYFVCIHLKYSEDSLIRSIGADENVNNSCNPVG